VTWYFYVAAVGFGLIFGSFFNVAIYRLPRRKTLDSRSMCPACGAVIGWYDNIPVASFIILKRRCRNCGQPISWRYPLVEISTALLFALMYWWSIEVVPGLLEVSGDRPFQPELIIGLVLASVLVVITGCDLTHGIIPNKAVAAGLIVMLPTVVGCALYRHQPGRIGLAVLTSVAGSAFFLIAGLLYGAFFMRSGGEGEEEDGDLAPADAEDAKRGAERTDTAAHTDETQPGVEEQDTEILTGIGIGDMKLMLFTGLALGYFHWYFLIAHIFLSCLIAVAAMLPLMLFFGKGRKSRIPFGPFLAAGAIVTILWGQALTDLYIRIIR
jgi:leader peptidase (prepilin peptidase)/N-methyltransferase